MRPSAFAIASGVPVTVRFRNRLQWQADRVNSILLHLRIETFYLVADILLDRVAKTFEWHFGQPAEKLGPRLAKHDHMEKNLVPYAEEKQLSPPEALPQLARQLRKRIRTYRNRLIVHANDLRTIRATIISSLHDEQQEAAISTSRVFAKEGDPRAVTSETPQALLRPIAEYVVVVVDYIQANFDKISYSD